MTLNSVCIIVENRRIGNLSWCLQLLDCNILNLEDFDVSLLMKTKGKDCHVILNAVSGPEICHVVSCLATFGHCVQLVQAFMTRNKSIGKTKHDSMCFLIIKIYLNIWITLLTVSFKIQCMLNEDTEIVCFDYRIYKKYNF